MVASLTAGQDTGRDTESVGSRLMEQGGREPGLTKLEKTHHQRWLGVGVAACVFHLIANITGLIVASSWLHQALNPPRRCEFCGVVEFINTIAVPVISVDILASILTLVALRRDWLCPKILATVWHCLYLAAACMLFRISETSLIILGAVLVVLRAGYVVIFSVLAHYHRKGGRW